MSLFGAQRFVLNSTFLALSDFLHASLLILFLFLLQLIVKMPSISPRCDTRVNTSNMEEQIETGTLDELTSLATSTINDTVAKHGEDSPRDAPLVELPVRQTIDRSPSSSSCGLLRALDDYFKISERGSSIGTEIRGGIVGFLTVAYIMLLNPQVLSVSGLPYKNAASATCLASCVATLICGVWGNLPVGCGPGLGLSAYFVYGMVPSFDGHVQDPYLGGLLMVFLSGLTVFVLTVPGLVTRIVKKLPDFIKVACIVGMGLFLAFIGMIDIGLVAAATGQGSAILELGDMTSWVLWLSLANFILIGTFSYYKLKGSLILCIVIVSLLYFIISGDWPQEFVQMPRFQNPLLVLDFAMLTHLPLAAIFESVISFVLILFVDTSGSCFAIANLAGLSDQLPSFQKSAFVGCSIGSMIAAVLGCTPMIVCIETTSAIAAGARTGLSAVVIACFFLLTLFFGPALGEVPSVATSPILIFIGTLMMGQVGQIDWNNMRIAIPAFLCILIMPFTCSIANGLFFGVISYLLMWMTTGQFLAKWGCCGYKKDLDSKLGYSGDSCKV